MNKQPTKTKKYRVRRFFKELKRVRWPSNSHNWTSFFKVVVFTVVFTIIIVLFATLIGLLWKTLGLK
ncbi:preprotein translocase subunit SecE [Mycoplasmopsis californica]|uniref:Preprotein translocase subunit SecE n=1 Tax=Mycoplasmopsis californica TaxID=2113 RepID=A0A059XQ94_9BACT|nr:preprotein translocase subunit SecE [Mycoplasmopsis californica]AIA29195.1 preprotein translocase subunit SecE [Mycoplasmopsis californica]